LQAQGIDAEVRGQALLTTVEGAAIIPGMRPAVWILRTEQCARAQEIVARYQRGQPQDSSATAWECPRCHEPLDAPFTHCWQCGTARPGSAG